MPRTKNFNSMNLLEKVEYLVKKQLPKENNLTQTSLRVTYNLTVNINTEDNPFELTSKTYEVIIECFSDAPDSAYVMVKDETKLIKEFNLNLKENAINLNNLIE